MAEFGPARSAYEGAAMESISLVLVEARTGAGWAVNGFTYHQKKLVYKDKKGIYHVIDAGIPDGRHIPGPRLIMIADEYPSEADYRRAARAGRWSEPEILATGRDLSDQWAKAVAHLQLMTGSKDDQTP